MTKTPIIILVLCLIAGIYFYSQRTTPFRKYYDDGNPKILGFYLDRTGKKHGEWTYYYENGNLKEIIDYSNGEEMYLRWYKYSDGYGYLKSINHYKKKRFYKEEFFDNNGKWIKTEYPK